MAAHSTGASDVLYDAAADAELLADELLDDGYPSYRASALAATIEQVADAIADAFDLPVRDWDDQKEERLAAAGRCFDAAAHADCRVAAVGAVLATPSYEGRRAGMVNREAGRLLNALMCVMLDIAETHRPGTFRPYAGFGSTAHTAYLQRIASVRLARWAAMIDGEPVPALPSNRTLGKPVATP